MEPIEVRAGFTSCNIKAGKVVMQFELDPEYRPLLGQLAGATGSLVFLTIDSPQQTLFVDRESGEVLDDLEDENEWESDEVIATPDDDLYPDGEDPEEAFSSPYELPPAAYDYEAYEDEDAA